MAMKKWVDRKSKKSPNKMTVTPKEPQNVLYILK